MGQETVSFENIAFKYFKDNILNKEFNKIKKFELKDKVDLSSNGYSTCMPMKEKDTIKANILLINDAYDKRMKSKFSFFDKVFISKKERAKIVVFKSYPSLNYVIVCICVYEEIKDKYLTFKINRNSMLVEDYCITSMIH